MLDPSKSTQIAGRAIELIRLFLFSHDEEFNLFNPIFVEDGVFKALRMMSIVSFDSYSNLNYATEHLKLLQKYFNTMAKLNEAFD